MKLKIAVLPIALLGIYLLAMVIIIYYTLSNPHMFNLAGGRFTRNMFTCALLLANIPMFIYILRILTPQIKSPLRFAKIGLILFSSAASLAYIWVFVSATFDSEYYYFLLTLALPILLLEARLAKIFLPNYSWPLWTNSDWYITLTGFLQWAILGFVLGLLIDIGLHIKERVKS